MFRNPAFVLLLFMPPCSYVSSQPTLSEAYATPTNTIYLQAALCPSLPRDATVSVGMTVSALGIPDAATTVESSRDACIDAAALNAAMNAGYLPGAQGGKPVESHIVVSVHLAEPKQRPSTVIPPHPIQPIELHGTPCHKKDLHAFAARVTFIVDTKGSPQRVMLAKSSGALCFDAAVIESVQRSSFKPATQNKKAVSFPMLIENFYTAY